MRVFVEPSALVTGELVLAGDEHHYLGRVRRARPGDAVEVVDGHGRRAAATIARITDAETVLVVGEPAAIAARPPHVRVLVPPIKGDRMETCLEKLAEVGVDDVVVWPAARAVVRLDGKVEARLAKYRGILQAASRQSGRARVPEVRYAHDLAAAIACCPDLGQRIVLDPAADTELTVDTGMDDVTLASGPEGGLASTELEQLAAAGFVAHGLGPRVLRAETAPTIAVALVRATTRS